MIAYNRKSAFRFYPALLMLAATIILASAEEHYQISSSRSQLIFIYNSITLSCSSIPDGVSGVSFFLNGSLVNFGNIHSFSFAFVIDPSLEGDYTCGVGEEQGAPVRLVAYPGIPILQPQTFYGAVNTTARLDCLVTPGRLVDHYYVTWQHGSDSNIQYFRLLPLHLRTENNSIVRLNDRYSIDYTNFSLFISNVEPGETGSEFICLMGVTDPLHPDNVYLYSTALTTKITMSLYWTPEFTMTPLSHTFLESDASSATFSCSAVSAPGPPKIAWRHNGAMVTDYLVDFFAVPDMPVGGGRYPPPPTRVEIFYDPEKSMVAFETSSSLTVNGLSLADDGTAVECCVAYFNDTLLLHTECKPALLTIVVEPEISLQPSVLTVAAGLQTTATFTLSFTVDSSMANHYSYKIIFKHRGDQASLQSNKYQVENSTSLERFRSEGLLSVVFTIEDLVWPEDGGIVECVVMTYTNNGSIEFIDSLIGNTSTSARLDIIKLTVTQIDTADPNNITLKCATVDDNMAESETAIFEFSDISGQTQLLLLVGGEAKLNMSATGDVVGTCTLRGVTSAPVAIASLPHSPAHTTSHTVEARPGETASLDCPFPYTPLQNTLSVFHISWLRLSSSGGSAQGVESDPNMKRYGTGLGNRGLSTLTVPVEEGDVAMPLQFRCVLQLSRCNDSENALCGVTEVLGPLITVRGKGLSNDSDYHL